MRHYPFNRTLLSSQAKTDELRTITGQRIRRGISFPSDEDKFHESYPLRQILAEITLSTVENLGKQGRTFDSVMTAASIVRDEMWRALDEMIDSADAEDLANGYELQYFTGSTYKPIGNEDFFSWHVYSSPHGPIECVIDDLPGKLEPSSETPWDWPAIYLLVALWAVDEAATYINQKSPYKAASWASRAQKFCDWALDEMQSQAESTTSNLSSFFSLNGKAGAIKRHAPTQKLKAWAIEQYKAGEWPSANKAAFELRDAVIEQGRTLGVNLFESNAQRTIAEWFRKET